MPGIIWRCARPERQGIGEDAMIPVGPMVVVANTIEDDRGTINKLIKKKIKKEWQEATTLGPSVGGLLVTSQGPTLGPFRELAKTP